MLEQPADVVGGQFGAEHRVVVDDPLEQVAFAFLLDAIRLVAAGESLLSPTATRSLIVSFLSQPSRVAAAGAPSQLERLTDREREIVALVAEGMTNDEIADRLVISPMTVKTHVNRSMTKLDLRDRAQLVVAAYQSGLVRVGPADSSGRSDDA